MGIVLFYLKSVFVRTVSREPLSGEACVEVTVVHNLEEPGGACRSTVGEATRAPSYPVRKLLLQGAGSPGGRRSHSCKPCHRSACVHTATCLKRAEVKLDCQKTHQGRPGWTEKYRQRRCYSRIITVWL